MDLGVADLCGDDPDEDLREDRLRPVEEELTEVEVRQCDVDNQRWKELVADLSAVETRTLVFCSAGKVPTCSRDLERSFGYLHQVAKLRIVSGEDALRSGEGTDLRPGSFVASQPGHLSNYDLWRRTPRQWKGRERGMSGEEWHSVGTSSFRGSENVLAVSCPTGGRGSSTGTVEKTGHAGAPFVAFPYKGFGKVQTLAAVKRKSRI